MHKVFIFTFVITVSLSAIGAQAESYKRTLREYVEGSVLMLVIITEEETNLEKKIEPYLTGSSLKRQNVWRRQPTRELSRISYSPLKAEENFIFTYIRTP